MFRRLFWLSAIAGIGYLAWRWVRKQNEVPTPTSEALYPPPATAQTLTQTAAPAPLGAPGSTAPAAPVTPRRIVTRVHKGAPPPSSRSDAPAEPGSTPAAPPTPEAPDLADLVGPEAAGEIPDLADLVGPEAAGEIPDLADLVGPEAAGADELSEIVGAAVTGEEADDLSSLVSVGAADPMAPDALPVNINTADEDTLVALPGIGPALARRIIIYRSENGPFATVEDLEVIQGIGPRNIEEFRHLVTV